MMTGITLQEECRGCGAPVRFVACPDCITRLEHQPDICSRVTTHFEIAEAMRQREAGATLRAIGEPRGLSVERVRQILSTGRRLIVMLSKRSGAKAQPYDSIDTLLLSIRSHNCLLNNGCRTVGDVVAVMQDKASLLRWPNFGLKSYAEVSRVLNDQGLPVPGQTGSVPKAKEGKSMTEIFKDHAGEWRFRIKGKNGEIVATSEGYTRSADARRGLLDLRRILTETADTEPRLV